MLLMFITSCRPSSVWSLAAPAPAPTKSKTTTAPDRVAWDGLRFLQQSSKFVAVPSWLSGSGGKNDVVPLSPGDVLWTAADTKQNSFTMAPLDDVVMGGASMGTFDTVTGTWSATVTDANNGGFVGLRSTPIVRYDATKCRGLSWQVRLEGKVARPVKFVLRDSIDFNGITHTFIATLKPGKNTVNVPFDRLVPAKFAQILNDGKPCFASASLSGVQITYSKFEYDGKLSKGFSTGDFRLQLLSLKAY
jgi:hypothetical protein